MVDHQLRGLRTARERAEITAPDAAAAIGVTPRSYYRLETGVRRMYFDKACRLADLFGCSLDDLRRDPDAADGARGTVVDAALGDWSAPE
jgi:transcriptional regulator with XRE-family HTH domain